jgi:hypothetical protein
VASDALEGETRIKATEIVHVAGHDYGPFAAGDQHDRGVDDVGRPGTAAKDPRGFSQELIEKRNARRRPFDEGAERRLPARASPDLTEDASRDDQARVLLERLANEGTHPRIAALERDEGAGV